MQKDKERDTDIMRSNADSEKKRHNQVLCRQGREREREGGGGDIRRDLIKWRKRERVQLNGKLDDCTCRQTEREGGREGNDRN